MFGMIWHIKQYNKRSRMNRQLSAWWRTHYFELVLHSTKTVSQTWFKSDLLENVLWLLEKVLHSTKTVSQTVFASIVQWIEQRTPNAPIQVRLLVEAQGLTLKAFAFRVIAFVAYTEVERRKRWNQLELVKAARWAVSRGTYERKRISDRQDNSWWRHTKH